jgi:hypothetical protein
MQYVGECERSKALAVYSVQYLTCAFPAESLWSLSQIHNWICLLRLDYFGSFSAVWISYHSNLFSLPILLSSIQSVRYDRIDPPSLITIWVLEWCGCLYFPGEESELHPGQSQGSLGTTCIQTNRYRCESVDGIYVLFLSQSVWKLLLIYLDHHELHIIVRL